MKGLTRSLRYWTFAFEKQMLAMLSGMAIAVFAMTLVDGGIFDGENLVDSLLGYIWVFAFISIFVNGFMAAQTYFGMAVSLGTTRRAGYAGMQIVQHLMLVQYFVLGGLAYYFWSRPTFELLASCVLALIGVALILMALTNCTCILTRRFGIVAGTVAYVVTLLLIIGVVFLFIFSTGSENAAPMLEKSQLEMLIKTPLLFYIGALADGITVVLYYLTVKKCDLQM